MKKTSLILALLVGLSMTFSVTLPDSRKVELHFEVKKTSV